MIFFLLSLSDSRSYSLSLAPLCQLVSGTAAACLAALPASFSHNSLPSSCSSSFSVKLSSLQKLQGNKGIIDSIRTDTRCVCARAYGNPSMHVCFVSLPSASLFLSGGCATIVAFSLLASDKWLQSFSDLRL